ncbi:tripartite motif-containing protein 55-like [Penaeus japonicus]|uniref:tripartite motif-containing protein 55-like n=1 Tax=Penaeus japonicus TaxID=27405 RepID=UPI001C716089|nr:tripartite motif-containing protein 55-like [Penaeus japonicus]
MKKLFFSPSQKLPKNRKPEKHASTMSFSNPSTSKLDGVLTCAVCFDTFCEGERKPLMLPSCGHTFCKQCLHGIIARENKGQFQCPTCRRSQPVLSLEDLPVNYSLLEVATLSPTTSPEEGPTQRTLKDEERCPDHDSRLAFWCSSCESATCGECLFESHPRPDHDVLKIEDHFKKIQEETKRRSNRLVRQMSNISEENVSMVKHALVHMAELLRQRREIGSIQDEARGVRDAAKDVEGLLGLSSVSKAIATLQEKFGRAGIETPSQVQVMGGGSSMPEGDTPVTRDVETPVTPVDQMLTTPMDEIYITPVGEYPDTAVDEIFTTPVDETTVDEIYTTATEETPTPPMAETPPTPVRNTTAPARPPVSAPKPPLARKPALPPRPPTITPRPTSLYGLTPALPSPSPSPILTSKDAPIPPTTPTVDASTQTLPEDDASKSRDCPENGNPQRLPRSLTTPPRWPSVLCGVYSSNWTSGRISVEPKGLHVYALGAMKEKCDMFLHLSVIEGLAPLESPMVFMDLRAGSSALGRIYITLQIHLRSAQQFFSLCLGDRGPSYKGSCFHSVLRRGGAGEGLAGGDYELKAGKGGAAIIRAADEKGAKAWAEAWTAEVAKRCERGMVTRASTRPETAAQFFISVKDGPRFKTVFPFGRVTRGLEVVEEACRRPALSVRVADCGWVLPL